MPLVHGKIYDVWKKDLFTGRCIMNVGWICGFFIGILGIIGHFTYIHMVSEYNYWLLMIGFFLVSLSGTRRY